MHPRQRYIKKFRGQKDRRQDWPFWKVVLAGWFIRSPMKFIRVACGIVLFIVLVGYEFVPQEKNHQYQNTPQRSY